MKLNQIVASLIANGMSAEESHRKTLGYLKLNAEMTAKVIVRQSDWDTLREAFKPAYADRMYSTGVWQKLARPVELDDSGKVKEGTVKTDAIKASIAGYRSVMQERARTTARAFSRWVVKPTTTAYPDMPKPATLAKAPKARDADREAFVAQRDMLTAWVGRDVETAIRYDRMSFISKCIKYEKRVGEFLSNMRGPMKKAA